MVTVNNSTASNDSRTEHQIVDMVYPPILILSGTVFNTLIIMVMCTRAFKKHSTSVYMISAAVNDTFGLLVSMTTHWLYVAFDGVYVKEKVGHICKFLDFYGWSNCDFGILIISAMTVDRAFAITFPLKHASKTSIPRSRVIVVFLGIIILCKNFHFLIGSNMVAQTRLERLCDVMPLSPSYEYFWKHVWPWLHFGFLSCCFCVIVISNVVLSVNVWKSSRSGKSNSFLRKEKPQQTPGNGSPTFSEKQWMAIAPMLIGESVFILFFTFPFTVQLFVSGYNPEFYSTLNRRLLFSMTFYMLYTNKCLTFVVYLVTGSRFRRAIKDIFIMCCHGQQALRQKRFREKFARSVWNATLSNSTESLRSNASSHRKSSFCFHRNPRKTSWTPPGSDILSCRKGSVNSVTLCGFDHAHMRDRKLSDTLEKYVCMEMNHNFQTRPSMEKPSMTARGSLTTSEEGSVIFLNAKPDNGVIIKPKPRLNGAFYSYSCGCPTDISNESLGLPENTSCKMVYDINGVELKTTKM